MLSRTPRIARVLCTAAALLICTSAFAQLSFVEEEAENGQTYASPNTPSDLFVADLNGDGHPDIVTTQSTGTAVTVFLNKGDGTFVDGGSAQYLTGNNPLRVVVADFNADGKLDIATANCDSVTHAGSVSLLLGNGDGTFQTHQDLPLAGCPNSLGIIRANADTRPDLVVAQDVTNDIQVLINSGGAFTPGTRIVAPAGQTFRGVSAADYNRDGKADIAAIQAPLAGGSSSVVLFLANATGFSPKTIFTVASDALAANTVDVNGDGVADLLVSVTDVNGGGQVEVLTNNNNAALWTTSTLSGPFDVGWKSAVADFDHNSFGDIVVPLSPFGDSGGYAAFGGTSKGSWAIPIEAETGSFGETDRPWATAIADFAAPGKLGVAGVNIAVNTLQVYPQPLDIVHGCFADDGSNNICSPTQGAVLTSPFHLSADGERMTVSPDANVTPILVAMRAYLDGKQVVAIDKVDTSLAIEQDMPASVGKHTVVVNAWDQTGRLQQFKTSFSIAAISAGTCVAPTTAGVKVCAPANGSTTGSPVSVSAAANGGTRTISAMRGYLDGKQVLASSNALLTGSITAAAGKHTLMVHAWNSAGTLFSSTVTFTVK
jgi:hypothetical protein